MAVMRGHPGRNRELTADTPLTPQEQMFVTEYIKTGNSQEAARVAYPGRAVRTAQTIAHKLMYQPHIQAEIKKVMDELRKETIATADEVMTYFTGVMRGEIKDQFGLDAPLAERTKAAQEIAKRTIDIENRANGKADTVIEVKLNWED